MRTPCSLNCRIGMESNQSASTQVLHHAGQCKSNHPQNQEKMVRRKNAKTTALILTILLPLIHILPIDPHCIGLYEGTPAFTRFTYQFFHASWLHLFINIWCLLSLVFNYDLSIWNFFWAFLISAAVPVLWAIPTIGLSGFCFALIGIAGFSVRNKRLYHTWAIGIILLGFFSSGVNASLHLFCYLVGLFVGWFNKPTV